MEQMTQQIPIGTAKKLLSRHYALEGEVVPLPGTEDHNFQVITSSGKFLLKLSRPQPDLDYFAFQHALLSHLEAKSSGEIDLPAPILTSEGAPYFEYTDPHGEARLGRVLSWIPGRLWSEVNPITAALRYQLGNYCGNLSRMLSDFDHPAAHQQMQWDVAQGLWAAEALQRFPDERKALLSYFLDRFSENQPNYSRLRKQVVHNDVNDNNIVVAGRGDDARVVACIDFGDALHTQVINDVAIALTYAILHVPDPLQAALALLKGYHKAFPLQEQELEHLYDCVGMRLVISVVQSAIGREKEPENTYLQISEEPAWELLRKWRSVSPELAHYSFRTSCGFPAHPALEKFKRWTSDRQFPLGSLFPAVPRSKVVPLDLSVGSSWVGLEDSFNDLDEFTFKIDRLLKQNPGAIPAGGYLEPRPLYTAEAYEKTGNERAEHRSVHLGVDFWLPAGTAVHAPMEGKVVIATIDDGHKEYGGLVILEHQKEGLNFYSLYGHLSHGSIHALSLGQLIPEGGRIGYLGTPEENGSWVPHLHFQLMLSILDYTLDFPGVCYPDQTDIWAGICPDPNWLFKQPGLEPRKSWDTATLLSFRKEHLGRSLSLQYQDPLYIVRGSGAFLVDAEGRKYLDTVNNVAHVGHEHPAVVKAGQAQMALLNTNTRYLHPEINRLTQELLKTLPPELSVVHFVNSGSEANELALRMVQAATGSREMIASQWGYHGNTHATVAISSYKFDRKGGQGCPPHVHLVPMPDTFRGLHRGPAAGPAYAQEVEKIIQGLQKSGKALGGLIMEPILSCGGQVVLAEGFLTEAYQQVRKAGGLCISDEVQVGCGRLGEVFWGFQLHEVVPDIITIGKPLGNGHPLAAVVCTEAVAEQFANGMEYFNTFGGNPVSCAIGRTVLQTVREAGLQQNAAETGGYLKQQLKTLQDQFPVIGDVRGHGFFLGIELNGPDRSPLPQQADYLVNRMKHMGVLMSTDGPDNNVIKIKPPLVFSKENADYLLNALERVLGEDFMRTGT